ncbi:unnamed protein product [Prorocentrum cordatum]|uniref:Uncharacterized protein n=1 Tax=Prorocentrum cordatum TaxID=2364126 RepID=A0ABN9S5X3_9DINO|nr:unnamed protein product [Polarella glacialis]
MTAAAMPTADPQAREGRITAADAVEIASLSAAGAAAIERRFVEAGETDFRDNLGYKAEAEVLRDALGLPGGEAHDLRQPHVQVGEMEPRRQAWLRRHVGALELAHMPDRP